MLPNPGILTAQGTNSSDLWMGRALGQNYFMLSNHIIYKYWKFYACSHSCTYMAGSFGSNEEEDSGRSVCRRGRLH